MASRTAFVAYGDTGGDEHVQKLVNNGVSTKQITYLGGQGSELSIEDLLVKDLHRAAVNDVLEGLSAGLTMPETEIPTTGRSHAVAAWGETQLVGGKALRIRKAAVAQRILDTRTPGTSLVPPARRRTLQALHRAILKILETPTQKL